jgi:hypothetical protein
MTDGPTLVDALSGWSSLTLDQLAERLAQLPKDSRDAIMGVAEDATRGIKWLANSGPQAEAFFSKADVLLYGGQAAGGKSDLLLGLALTAHRRSLIMRQEFTALTALTKRAIEINGTKRGYNGSNPPSLTTDDGRFVQFTGAQMDKWKGAAFDAKFFDEVVDIPEEVVRFHMTWVRSADATQRTRVVLASNPPISAGGDWLIPMFAPWLDNNYPNPAQDGELRWVVSDPEGHDLFVDGPEPYQFPGEPRPVIPMSRTFIRASLSDNPSLNTPEYQSKLDSLEEPFRSAYRDGNFLAARKDQSYQILPTEWVLLAQQRWKRDGGRDLMMSSMGVDVGQGGADRVVIARRHGEWYAPLIVVAGKDAPDGSKQASLIVQHRRDGCSVVVDVSGGYGGDVVGRLKDNQITAVQFNGSAGSVARAKDGSNRIFENKRAEAWWRFREALNPDRSGGSIIQLPDDSALRAELTAPCFVPDMLKIQVEDKKDIKKRLGRSPDLADAVVMAYAPGEAALRKGRFGGAYGGGRDMPTSVNRGYSDIKRGFGGGNG